MKTDCDIELKFLYISNSPACSVMESDHKGLLGLPLFDETPLTGEWDVCLLPMDPHHIATYACVCSCHGPNALPPHSMDA